MSRTSETPKPFCTLCTHSRAPSKISIQATDPWDWASPLFTEQDCSLLAFRVEPSLLSGVFPSLQDKGMHGGQNPDRTWGTLWAEETQLSSRKTRAASVHRTECQRGGRHTKSVLWTSAGDCLLGFSRVLISTCVWWHYPGPREKPSEKIRDTVPQLVQGWEYVFPPVRLENLIIHWALGLRRIFPQCWRKNDS